MYSREWEWAIEFHPNLPTATPSKSGWYENDGKLSAITMTKEEALPQAINKSFIVAFYWAYNHWGGGVSERDWGALGFVIEN